MQLSKAKAIALIIKIDLLAYCELVDIGGSVRRECATVGDIEIICKPNPHMINRLGMYMMGRGKVLSGKFDGRYIKIWLNEGIQLDLFIPQPHDYYRQLAIRTGSKNFTYNTLATQWARLGWCGTDDGLRRRSDCMKKTASGPWICTNPNPELPPVWENEKQFFEWLQLEYVEPKDRI